MNKGRFILVLLFVGVPLLLLAGFGYFLFSPLNEEQLLRIAIDKYEDYCAVESVCNLLEQEPKIDRIDRGYKYVWRGDLDYRYTVLVTDQGKVFWISNTEK
ncbi:MAG: hypothetical protein NPIRA03_41490 [Nitrospirales bacterium]|nr:MAG: hypothetical protein NPIRA03_41490 [Nitrospirales bacterium]